MSLIPWRNKRKDSELERITPERSLRTLRSDVDRLFDRFLGEFEPPWGGLFSGLGAWTPAFDVAETDQEITIRAEVPGVNPQDIEVTVSGNVLTIGGEKKESTDEQRGEVCRSERRFGKFRRSIELPASVDAEKVTAQHKNGVLTVRLQRSEAAAPKRISVKAGTP